MAALDAIEAALYERHPDELPTFAPRARNSARRLGIFGLDVPHIWLADGVWSRTRCQRNDLDELAGGFADELAGRHTSAREAWRTSWAERTLGLCPV